MLRSSEKDARIYKAKGGYIIETSTRNYTNSEDGSDYVYEENKIVVNDLGMLSAELTEYFSGD